MQPQDLENAPKLFCENIKLGYSNEFFIMAVRSGSQGSVFTLTPQHAKRLLQYLNHEITEYEKENGTINASWDPHVLSPVQQAKLPTDLS